MRHDLLILVLIDLAAVVVAAGVGAFVSGRLSRPLRTIRDDAVRLGSGDFSIVAHHSGIDELGLAFLIDDDLAEIHRELSAAAGPRPS